MRSTRFCYVSVSSSLTVNRPSISPSSNAATNHRNESTISFDISFTKFHIIIIITPTLNIKLTNHFRAKLMHLKFSDFRPSGFVKQVDLRSKKIIFFLFCCHVKHCDADIRNKKHIRTIMAF